MTHKQQVEVSFKSDVCLKTVAKWDRGGENLRSAQKKAIEATVAQLGYQRAVQPTVETQAS